MKSLKISELIKSTNAKLVNGNLNDEINDVVIDSRKANKDNVFIAIIGESLDGHKYMESAYENGCRNFIKNSNSVINIEYKDINLIEVENTEQALGQIAKYYKQKFDIPFVGVTGSVGKTTTKDMIYAAISSKLNVHKNEGNLNNNFGVPLTLFGLNESHQAAIIEMGMSHFKEIEYLANLVHPQIGVISNIGLSHIENLGSQEGILEAKLELTANFDENNILIVNGDDEFLSKLKEKKLKYQLKTFGFDKTNNIYCESFETYEDKIVFECVVENQKHQIEIPTLGEHNIYNAMAAILVGLSIGLTIEDIKIGFLGYRASKMRLDVSKNEKYTVINDAYNASPDSMIAALKILKRYNQRRVAILGDMFEMGEHAEYGHRLVGKDTLDSCDVIITIGKDSMYISDEAKKIGFNESNIHHFKTKEEAINNLENIIKKEDVILLKASRGMALEEIAKYLK